MSDLVGIHTTSPASFVPLTDSGERIVKQQIEITSSDNINPEQLEFVFEVERTVAWIRTGGFKKVALQFPDVLLQYASAVCAALNSGLPAHVTTFVVADTSYGSCCIDFVTAQHWAADALVHFGDACLSSTAQQIPVLYVIPQKVLDVSALVAAATASKMNRSNGWVIVHELGYRNAMEQVVNQLRPIFPNIQLAQTVLELTAKENQQPQSNVPSASAGPNTIPSDPSFADELESLHINTPDVGSADAFQNQNSRSITINGQSFEKPEGETPLSFLWIGSECLQLTNLLLNFGSSTIWKFDPNDNQLSPEEHRSNRLLMQRFHLIQRAIDANVIGILVATLALDKHREVISALREEIEQSGRKSYTFVVGKINVAKLANFGEIDLFVVVACPLNSLISSKEFYRPIVTPFELRIALAEGRTWTGEYNNDFSKFLDAANKAKETVLSEVEAHDARISLVSNRIIAKPQSSNEVVSVDGTLVTVNQSRELMSSPAVVALQQRTFKGIEARQGMDEVMEVIEGRKGVASHFESEPELGKQ